MYFVMAYDAKLHFSTFFRIYFQMNTANKFIILYSHYKFKHYIMS